MHIADIIPSILSGLGLVDVQSRHEFGDSSHGRECLLLIDGMGASVLSDFASLIPAMNSMLHLASAETAFPSTTATSLPTLITGEMPGVHGMVGYSVRVPRSGGRVLNSLKWDERVDPSIWQPIPTLFEKAKMAGITVAHVASARYESSGFTRAAFRGARYFAAQGRTEMVQQTSRALAQSPSFAYLYLNDLDVAGHASGVGSPSWIAALTSIDATVQALLENLPPHTRLWITSDHGMVNVGEKIVIGNGNPLLQGVSLIAGEPRARHIYLREGAPSGGTVQDVANIWQEFLGERACVHTRESAISRGIFGPNVSRDASERIGDLVVIAHDALVLIDPARESLEWEMIGHHGALSNEERFVPLMVSEIRR